MLSEQDKKFVIEFSKLKTRMDEASYKVQSAIKTGVLEAELSALREEVNNLPQMIEDIRNLPDPESARYRGVKENYEKGITTYMKGCSHFIKALETHDRLETFKGIEQIEAATKAMQAIYHLTH